MLSSFILTKWLKHALAHIFHLHIRADLYSTSGELIIYPELALCGAKIECARTDNAFFPISEVCNGTVSIMQLIVFVPLFNVKVNIYKTKSHK